MNRELAKIKDTFLGVEDHGVFTFILDVEYDSGMSQGVGTMILDKPEFENPEEQTGYKSRHGTAFGMEMIMQVIKAVGVKNWEELKGKNIWVLTEDDTFGDRPIGIQGTFDPGGKRKVMFEDVVNMYKEELEK